MPDKWTINLDDLRGRATGVGRGLRARAAAVVRTLRERTTVVIRTLRKRFAGSLLGLLMFGFLLVCAPLVFGLVISGQQIGRVTQQSESVLRESVERSRAVRLVQERLVGLERAARQYRVLLDDDAYTSLQRQFAAFNQGLASLRELALNRELAVVAGQLSERAVVLNEKLGLADDTGISRDLDDHFQQMDELAEQLLTLNEHAANQGLERVTRLGGRARTTALIQLALIVPFAVVMAIVFTNLINRPVRQLERGIRALAGPAPGKIPEIPSPRDLRALSVRLEWARRKLNRVERDRQRLIGQVSHELKTPLSAIQEGVSLLDDDVFGQLTEEQLEVLSILKTNGDRLNQQIESLLRYNRLSTEALTIDPKAFDCSRIIDAVLTDHGFALKARDLDIEQSVDRRLRAVGDPDILRTALDNLVSNAIKFSPVGATIGVFGSRVRNRIHIGVANQGPTIPPSERTRLFEPFYRGSRSSAPGTGLGLAITRDLVHAMNGTVTLTQREGWSTVFTVVVPTQFGEETVNEN